MTLTCSEISAEDEPLAGTAGEGLRWLCVEHPGPWGRDIIDAQVFGERTGAVADWADRADARLLCVRRPGSGYAPDTTARRVILAASEPSDCWSREWELSDLRELLDLDPQQAYRDPGGERRSTALICAHGRRDQCCAVKGRPVAAALAEAGYDVWEASHTGGHRFAPAMIVLPTGYVYGRLSPQGALAVMEAAGQSRVAVTGLRGRTCYTPRGQVAEIVIRERFGQGWAAGERFTLTDGAVFDGEGRTRLDHIDGRSWEVSVGAEALPPRPASCGAEPKPVQVLRCVGVEELG